MQALELYIHIPFCVRKCYYCDFLSGVSDENRREEYVKALLTEIRMCAGECEKYTVTSIFIGGGTPSLMQGARIERILEEIRRGYVLDKGVEITIEMNPGTVDEEKLAAYKRAGINRLSIGLQSAENEELKKIGRIHTWEQFLHTWQLVRNMGFQNVNVDIMSALPGQSVAGYERTLQRVLSLPDPPEHISAYSLIVEEGTDFYRWQEEGKLDLPGEDEDRQMYYLTKKLLAEKGYERYEISNYAKPGFACAHNCGYWKRAEYLGLGLGAASLLKNVRFHNTESLEKYLANPCGCREDVHVLTDGEQIEETLFLGLRLTMGISEKEFVGCFSRTLDEIYGDVIEKNIQNGLLRWTKQGEDRWLSLTEKGLDVSNYVMAQFLLEEE